MKEKNPKAANNFTPWLILGALTFVAVVAGFFIATKTAPASLGPSNAKAVVETSSYDWGEIDIDGGNATYQFVVENQGTDPLSLTNVKTSCACTSAQITINGQKSPYFGMHTTSSWVGTVPVGEKAYVDVIFDPLFHGPTAVGPIERLISLETNDASQQVLEFKLTGNVVKK